MKNKISKRVSNACNWNMLSNNKQKKKKKKKKKKKFGDGISVL